MTESRLRFREHAPDELAHYAKKAIDVEYRFPFGWKELEGIHNRGDFDLSRHQEASGENLEYFDPATEEHFIPFIVETAGGPDRAAFTFLIDSYREEEVRGEKRVVLGLHPDLAPYKVAVLPLLKKRPEIVELCHKLRADLAKDMLAVYDDTAAIGKLYRRQDEIGTPWCVTVDVESLEDGAVDGPRPRLDDPGARPDRGREAADPRPALGRARVGAPDERGGQRDHGRGPRLAGRAGRRPARPRRRSRSTRRNASSGHTRPARGRAGDPGHAPRPAGRRRRRSSPSSMSARTAGEIEAIIALETVLGELERAGGRSDWSRRDPELYWFAVFGEPGSAAPWSWRIGGHHVAIHLTLADDRVIGTTPSFLGANPAVVPTGRVRASGRCRARRRWRARCSRTLTPDGAPRGGRRRLGAGRHPHRDRAGGRRAVRPRRRPPRRPRRRPAGGARAADPPLRRSRPTGGRRRGLGSGSPTPASARSTFAWAGPRRPGRGHYYAVRGPGFVVEYDNTQNGANHIHAVWRDLENDWGEDLLAAHLAAAHGLRP